MAVREPLIELRIGPDGSVQLLVDGADAGEVDALEALVAEALRAPVQSRQVDAEATARRSEADLATIRARRG